MRIGVINEGSTKHRNQDVMRVLLGTGHEILNLGMKDEPDEPDLNYLHTALMTALALELQICDFVVGGCGTGQGYMNAALQFPGVFCGLILDPVDAWLFAQVNAGNCVSLALNKGYGGVGADINLQYVFEKLFMDPFGGGHPPHRREIQADARAQLQALSALSHRGMAEIVWTMERAVLLHALGFPGMAELVRKAKPETENGRALLNTLLKIMAAQGI